MSCIPSLLGRRRLPDVPHRQHEHVLDDGWVFACESVTPLVLNRPGRTGPRTTGPAGCPRRNAVRDRGSRSPILGVLGTGRDDRRWNERHCRDDHGLGDGTCERGLHPIVDHGGDDDPGNAPGEVACSSPYATPDPRHGARLSLSLGASPVSHMAAIGTMRNGSARAEAAAPGPRIGQIRDCRRQRTRRRRAHTS